MTKEHGHRKMVAMMKPKFLTLIFAILMGLFLLFPSSLFAFIPTDPYYSNQWALPIIKAPQAWDLSRGGSPDVVIAIIDSGVDIDHPDIQDNIWTNLGEIPDDRIDNDNNGYVDDIHGWDFISDKPDPNPKFSVFYTLQGSNHGTIVAGIAAGRGNNGIGITGLAWNVKIMPLRVLSAEGSGRTVEVIKAIDYAVDNGADVINFSFIGFQQSDQLIEAIERAWQNGLVIVAAAGNEKDASHRDLDQDPAYPICLDGDENMIIGVAATNEVEKKADFSSYGAKCVDISAPGTRIYSTLVYFPDDPSFREYYGGYWSGTSVAVPLVSGLAALIKSVNPKLTNREIRDIILEQSDDINSYNPDYQGRLGRGRINAYQAVKYAYQLARRAPSTSLIITGAGPGGGPHVRAFNSSGIEQAGFFAFSEEDRKGIDLASGDVDGDSNDEIIVGAGPGNPPRVRVFSQTGQLKAQFLAYSEGFRGGVRVASGDIDGDGKDEIITGAGPGGGPHVRIFDGQGKWLSHFFAYHPDFRGGVDVAAGDLSGDGRDEIITGAGPGGGPHVRVFDGWGHLHFHFFAFLESFRGGIEVASGDVDGDGKDDIIAGIASGASPYIRIYDENRELRCQILVDDHEFYGGVSVAAGDLDADGLAEIIVGPKTSHSPEIKIFDTSGKIISQFFVYSRFFLGGVNLATLSID